MRLNKYLLLTLLPAIFPLTAYGVRAESLIAQQIPKYQYPQDFVADYLKTCNQRAMSQGLAKEDANTMCNCTLNKFQSQYSVEQFKKLRQDSINNQQATHTLNEVGYSCLDQILYQP
jgi:uncharacterized membrane protein